MHVKKVVGAVLVLVVVGLASLVATLRYDAACTPEPPVQAGTPAMQAIVYRCYGAPDVLQLAEIAKPTPADDEVLVRIRAASINPVDWHYMRGKPYFMRLSSGFGAPASTRFGVDYAGTVEAVGSKVTRFRPGDEVFGARDGALAQFVVVRESRGIVARPANVEPAQAAGVGVAAVTALQGLRDRGRLSAGQKVLVNGASGGVGTYAVQIAKTYGAEVTGVCSTRNVALVRSLGADHVVDYTREDFTSGGERYDLVLDMVGNHGLLELRKVLTGDGVVVIVGAPGEDDWIGPLMAPVKALLLSPLVSQDFTFMIAEIRQEDLQALAQLMQAGRVRTVIDRRFPLRETPVAIGYLETGRARGKVIVDVADGA